MVTYACGLCHPLNTKLINWGKKSGESHKTMWAGIEFHLLSLS